MHIKKPEKTTLKEYTNYYEQKIPMAFNIDSNEIFNIFISSLWSRGKSAALSSATQHAIPPEFGGNWEAECFNTRFPLSTLPRVGYKYIYAM